jgi:hypothetical protein
MAKSDSVINLRGTFRGITFVKSATYGDHIRAARGSHKKAEVNEAFKKESKRLQSANVPAKIIKDAIDPYRSDFTGGLLWQRLVSIFRKQLRDHGSIDFGKIKPFEIHDDYRFERFLILQSIIKFNSKKSVVHVDIRYDHHPTFKRSSSIDGYRLSVIGIFPDLMKKVATTAAVESEIMRLTGAVTPLSVELDVPVNAESFIVCVKIDGCSKGVVSNTRTTKGLRVVGAGALVPKDLAT